MSSESNTPVVAPVVAVVEKKVKAPTLGAKHSRFMAFGHWFISQQDTELVSQEVREELYRKLMTFASLDEQTAFYDEFLSQVTATNKTIRKMVAASKKPAKAPKAPRAKKTKAVLPQDGLVAQLIADANSSDTEPVVSEQVTEKKPKAPRAKKEKAPVEPVANTVVEPSPELVAEPVVENVVEPVVEPVAPVVVEEVKKTKKAEKPKKSDSSDKPKKTKKTKAVEPVVATEELVEHDIHTRVVTLDDNVYLIDGDNNLYDMESPHCQVGTFNTETGKAVLN